MWSQHRWIRAAFVLFVLGALGLTWAALGGFSQGTHAAPPQMLEAQLQGEEREFLIPADTPISRDDVIMITGRPKGTAGDATGFGSCTGPGDHYLQDVTVVNPGGGRAAYRVEIVVLMFQGQDTLPPGTRLIPMVPLGSCSGPGFSAVYDKYIGTVE